MSKLVIVESPTKTKSLSKYLGSDYEIMASMGHVRDLPESKMGLEISEKGESFEFVPEYKVMKGKDEQVRKLKKAAEKADEIILASDPDREGEAIAWHVEALLSESKKKVAPKFKRIAFHSITKDAIMEALEHPREIDMSLVEAQQARRILDRLVGYKLSPILWKKVRRGLSAGRVQSVAVRLIVEKEREIEKFKPQEYWQIRVVLETNKGEEFVAELAKISDKKAVVDNGKKAGEIVEALEKGNYVVLEVRKSERRVAPHPPFKTSTLQQAAANVLGWSAKRTMNVAQKLYELGNITYHRTDSFNLAPVAIDGVRSFIGNTYGPEYLSKETRFYKSGGKVLAQEAHEAIRPTDFSRSPDRFEGQDALAADQARLYSLIWRRTLGCQMAEAVFDDTKVDIKCGDIRLLAAGVVMKFEGWKKLFGKDKEEQQNLPEMNEGDALERKKVLSEQKFTMPPARFNDASLIKELEKRGIGRPSTYAAIISTIQDRRYVEQKDKKFYVTSIGIAVTDFLVENFPEEMDYEFTAKMEDNLDEIAAGKLKWMTMLGTFWKVFRDKLEKVDKESARVGVPTKSTGQKCPLCGEGEVVIRDGKFGRFLSCNRYPDCKYTAPFIEYLEGVACEKCGKRVVLKKTRTGKDFFGCEDYPNCTWASWRKPQVKGEEKTDVVVEEKGGEE